MAALRRPVRERVLHPASTALERLVDVESAVTMEPRSAQFRRLAVASVAMLCVTGCSSNGGGGPSGPPLQSYSCCSSSDILTVRHPGDTVTLHWIATPAGPSARGKVSSVRLEASLSGPFASVSQLKASATAGTLKAPVVVTTDRLGDAPVSEIVIPKDAQAGTYNLSWTINESGGQVSAASVIQVAAQD